VVTGAADLIRLCRRYDLVIGLHEEPGDLRTSRTLLVGGPAYCAVKRYKTELLGLLEEQGADG